jgi:hypothetical protein
MLLGLSADNWIVLLAAVAATFYALEAAWYWQTSSEILTPDELAGLSDGRNVLEEMVEAVMAQSATSAKGARSASLAALLAVVTLIVSHF